MQTGFTKEQLERLDKDLLIQLLLSQQQQLAEMDEKRQPLMRTALSGRKTGDRADFCCVPD